MQEEKKAKSVSRHTVNIDRRENIIITGVIDVISFDEETVITETEMGILLIRGGNLHVNRLNLDNGELAVDGEINNITYEDHNNFGKSKSLLGKLFK